MYHEINLNCSYKIWCFLLIWKASQYKVAKSIFISTTVQHKVYSKVTSLVASTHQTCHCSHQNSLSKDVLFQERFLMNSIPSNFFIIFSFWSVINCYLSNTLPEILWQNLWKVVNWLAPNNVLFRIRHLKEISYEISCLYKEYQSIASYLVIRNQFMVQ